MKLTTKEFIIKAKDKHGDRYEYSKTVYIKARTKVIITCPIHGDFEQTPDNHVRGKGKGCIKCGLIAIGYKGSRGVDTFKELSKDKHNDYYNYDNAIYITGKDKVVICCPAHGYFKQTPNAHLRGQGCPKCGKESHWRRSEYIKKSKGKLCAFYTIRCFNEAEEFYKIGITMNSIKKRYCSLKSMPYSYEIVSEIHGEAGFIWDLEKEEKKKLKEFHYQPLIKFKGSKTECFTIYNK